MKLVEFFGQLDELKVETVPQSEQDGFEVKVWIDPTPQQIISLVNRNSFRGIYNKRSLCIWEAEEQGHARMLDSLLKNGLLSAHKEGILQLTYSGLVYLFFSKNLIEVEEWNHEVGNEYDNEKPIFIDGVYIGSYGVDAQNLSQIEYPYFHRWLGNRFNIMEAQSVVVDDVRVWKNLQFSELEILADKHDLRGYVGKQDAYVWVAAEAQHSDVFAQLVDRGIVTDRSMYTAVYIHHTKSTDISPTWADDHDEFLYRNHIRLIWSNRMPIDYNSRMIKAWFPKGKYSI